MEGKAVTLLKDILALAAISAFVVAFCSASKVVVTIIAVTRVLV
jgi:hypothetical protein